MSHPWTALVTCLACEITLPRHYDCYPCPRCGKTSTRGGPWERPMQFQEVRRVRSGLFGWRRIPVGYYLDRKGRRFDSWDGSVLDAQERGEVQP